MGVCISYQAFPEQSRLATLLQTNHRVAYLFGSLFSYGGGPFYWVEIDAEERDEILEDMAENSLFGSRAAVDTLTPESFSSLASQPYYIEAYAQWRELYIEAADRGESVLSYVG